ncbi:hypothetical protein BJX68DRAFT_259460 [Aspergillus pseudodeflectus]|uniref:Uncharacterized protein n=1 Tax=Aspergillus pseudodeflectus TaxID=176178 RepID=A0ABR4JCR4_9EURO
MSQSLPLKLFTPTPMLGYGYDIDEFWRVVEAERPSAMIIDGGSTDPGPFMLGSGKPLCSKESYVRDLGPILEACAKYKTKFLLSTACGAGTNPQTDYLISIIEEIARDKGYRFTVTSIKFKEDRALIKKKLDSQDISPCGPVPDLMAQDIDEAVTIVAQMGPEPWLEVLKDETVDIIISGRSYDPAPFAAYAMHHGVEASSAWHMGKIVECGGQCATPKGRSMLVTLNRESFILTPTREGEKCTPLSVGAHSMYEKTRPDQLPGPGGVLHLDKVTYHPQADGKSLLVKGSVLVPTPKYQIKLEGAQAIGYRTTFIGGIRDPILIAGLDGFLTIVRKTTKEQFPSLDEEGGPKLIFHVYGKNAIMGPAEPSKHVSHEIGLLGEAVGTTQAIADAIANFARTTCLHAAYPGQMATAGNFASPLTPLEQSLGPVYKFSVYHLMNVEDPISFFPIAKSYVGVPEGQVRAFPASTPSNGANGTAIADHGEKTATAPEEIVAPAVTKSLDPGLVPITDLAKVIRSKNAGPFELTLDILFINKDAFDRAQLSKALTAENLAKLYGLPESDIITLMFYEPALGWKCTLKRAWPQGSIGERDTFGAQQHVPLLGIKI